MSPSPPLSSPKRLSIAIRGWGTIVLSAAVVVGLLLQPVASAGGPLDRTRPATISWPTTPGWLCEGLDWQTAHLEVGTGGCQAVFGFAAAQSFNNWNASDQFNYSFEIPWVAEIDPSGDLVRIASPLAPVTWSGWVSQSAQEVDLHLNQTVNVTAASGLWTPNDSWYGSGPQWSISNATLATMHLTVTFHLSNTTSNASYNTTKNGSLGLKFDVGVSGWPWASSHDHLGIAFDSLGAGGAHFAFNASSQTLAEEWNVDNRTFAGLVFGGDATVASPTGAGAVANVTSEAGLFTAATPDRESLVLLAFGNVSGNFSSLSYDPYVEFGAGPWNAPIGNSPPSSTGTPPDSAAASVLVIEIALIPIAGVGVLIAGVIVRGHRLRRQGEELVDGMNRAISDGDRLP